MEVDCPGLPPFEPFLRHLQSVAHTSGIQAIRSAGRVMSDLRTSYSAHRCFIRGVHYGFDLAQRMAATFVIERTDKVNHLRAELKIAVKSARPELVAVIAAIEYQILVVRRLIDSLLYHVVFTQPWALKHMVLESRIRPVDTAILPRTLESAVDRNRADRMKFHVICDLSTAAQIGDLVEIDRTDPEIAPWRVIELKEGQVNQILSQMLEKSSGDLPASLLDDIAQRLGKRAVSQARRMKAQYRRQACLAELLTDDIGKNPASGQNVVLTPDVEVVGHYHGVVERLLERAACRGYAVANIDKCLLLVALRSEMAADYAQSAAAHVMYHHDHPEAPCLIADSHLREKELCAIREVGPIIDIVRHGLHDQIGQPIFLWPNEENITDLLLRRVFLFGRFDIDAFASLIRASGFRTSWITRQQATELGLGGLSFRLPGTQVFGLTVEDLSGAQQQLLSGFFGRVFRDLTRPAELIRLIRRHKTQMAKIREIHGFDSA